MCQDRITEKVRKISRLAESTGFMWPGHNPCTADQVQAALYASFTDGSISPSKLKEVAEAADRHYSSQNNEADKRKTHVNFVAKLKDLCLRGNIALRAPTQKDRELELSAR